MLTPAHHITPPAWMQDPDLARLLDVLNHDNINARMVGGCVRGLFYDQDAKDIDIACVFPPEDTIELCKAAGIKTIPTGLKHGTITAHINGKNFEITTLRRDIKTDGRHAEITQTQNWAEDAQRRDFTINALYADKDGHIYDPLGTGIEDIKNHIVRFIGDADTRITEDYLRILRFFRFYGEYHDGIADEPSLQACITHKAAMSNLSRERIEDEIFKILSSDNAAKAIELMQQAKLFDFQPNTIDGLKTLIPLQNQLEQPNNNTRFYILKLKRALIGHKKTLSFFNDLDAFQAQWDGNIPRNLYAFNREITIQGLLILKANGHDIDDITLANAMNMPVPIFPIIADDVMTTLKIEPGVAVGEAIKHAEQVWINSQFTLSREDILEKL